MGTPGPKNPTEIIQRPDPPLDLTDEQSDGIDVFRGANRGRQGHGHRSAHCGVCCCRIRTFDRQSLFFCLMASRSRLGPDQIFGLQSAKARQTIQL